MGNLAQNFINALTLGSTYALVAVGFTLVFGVLRLVYLGHAAVIAACAYVGYGVLRATGSVTLALVAGIVSGGILGLLVEWMAIRPVRGQHHLIPMVTSASFAIVVHELLRIFVAGGQSIAYPEAFTSTVIRFKLGDQTPYFTVGQLAVLLVTAAMVVALTWIVRKTWMGRAIRAVADSEQAASLLGVRVNATSARTLMLASMLAGAAGVLLGLTIAAIDPHFSTPLEFKAIAIVLFAGMGSIPAAVVGAYLLGFVESFAVVFLDTSYRDLFAYLVMIVILMVRPDGLMGRRVSQRV
ncbi:branched-chain amino acid ABC transporter permease [Ramlibacter sp.]|uniref:branched-chain amino acid ABC transporter permease n=1 Tax=Ramlibacter sp. TaxID=1917967 RepID=UPI003D1214A7